MKAVVRGSLFVVRDPAGVDVTNHEPRTTIHEPRITAVTAPLFPPEVLPPPRDPSREIRRARPSRYAPSVPPPCAPLPARIDCYRHPAPTKPEWHAAQQLCDLYLAETDPAQKKNYHDSMIDALLALTRNYWGDEPRATNHEPRRSHARDE